MAGRKPDYDVSTVRLFDTSKGEKDVKGHVGGGWLNKNGTISIKLNACVVLECHPDLIITLFPREKNGRSTRGQAKGSGPDGDTTTDNGDDIPF